MTLVDYIIVFLAGSFFFYGFSCLFSGHMIREFERYGLPQFRLLIGTLEITGAAGLVSGYYLPKIQILAASGLALLMLLGFLLRIKIKDSILQTLPAFLFLCLSLFVMLRLLTGMSGK